MKKILPAFLFALFTVAAFPSQKAMGYYDCSQYGFMAYYDGYSGCVCMSGYTWGTDLLGQTTCVSRDSVCRKQLGYSSRYNSLSKACECDFGYVIDNSTFGSGKCELGSFVCSNKHGFHSSYDSLSNVCSCDKDYTLDEDGQCVKKQNNVYFLLLQLDTDKREAVIQSAYDQKYYHIGYGIGCLDSSFSKYLGNFVVVNLGTDYYVDMFDKIVLQDHDQTCSILSREKVDSDFILTCPDADNGYQSTDGKCYCNAGYYWSEVASQCEIKPSIVNPITPPSSSVFKDVKGGGAYDSSILDLFKRGVVSGYTDGTYRPATILKRAELLKIVIGAAYGGADDKEASQCFSDINQNQWYAKYVCKAKDKGIVKGYPDGTFKPDQEIIFSEAVKISLEAYGKTFNTSPWYKGYIDYVNNNVVDFGNTAFDEKLTRGKMAHLIRNVMDKIGAE